MNGYDLFSLLNHEVCQIKTSNYLSENKENNIKMGGQMDTLKVGTENFRGPKMT